MATQSQRTQKPARSRTAQAATDRPFHEVLSDALRALWQDTDDNGERKGNGKQSIVMETLRLTASQADHVNKCLQHLDLLTWSGVGRGATYKVGKELVDITPEMAAAALEAFGPMPKAKSKTSTKARKRRARSEKAQPTPKDATLSPDAGATQPTILDPDAPNYFDQLVEQNHRLRVALEKSLETIENQRHRIGELNVQVEKLTGRLGHYEGGSSDIEKLLADNEALLARMPMV